MRILFTLLSSLLLCVGLHCQSKYFDAEFSELESITSVEQFQKHFKVPSKYEAYAIEGVQILELYDKTNGAFLGAYYDPNRIEVTRLRYVKNIKTLKLLMDKYPPSVALGLYNKKVTVGMSPDQVEIILGKPNSTKFKIDGSEQLIVHTYQNGSELVFREGYMDVADAKNEQ